MSQLSTLAQKACLAGLHFSGAARLLSPLTASSGAVLMLHHVQPEELKGFAPNRLLQITPQFLDSAIREVRRSGFDIVDMDEAAARLKGEVKATRPFVSLTFDDGYRDNRDHALPVLKRHGVPMTIYAATDFADGNGFLWWLVLERVVAKRQFIAVHWGGDLESFRCVNDAEKSAAFERIYWRLRAMPEKSARRIVAHLASESGIDHLSPCRELVMSWSELRELAAEPLVSVGAHTQSHTALASLSASEAHAEIAGSVLRIEETLGRPCRHFCYPYGDAGSAGRREFDIVARLGLQTGVTTRKGLLPISPGNGLTGLPRVSLNGHFQQLCYLKALLSGVPFAMLNALRRPALEPA